MAKDHVTVSNVARGQLLTCLYCGATMTVPLPIAVAKWGRIVRAFQKQHRACPAPADGSEIEPQMTQHHEQEA